METVEDVFNALRILDDGGRCRLEWIGESKSAAVLYFSKKRKKFKIFFDDSNVEISVEKRLFQYKFWETLGTRHYTEPDDGVEDVFDTVIWGLREFGGFGEGFGEYRAVHEDDESEKEDSAG